jgi:hypothetical protein
MRGYFTNSTGAKTKVQLRELITGWSEDADTGEKEFAEHYDKFYSDEGILTAARLMRHFSERAVRLTGAIANHCGYAEKHTYLEWGEGVPMMPLSYVVVNKGVVSVRVHEEIKIPVPSANNTLRNVWWCSGTDNLNIMATIIEADKGNPRNKKWETPARAIANMKRTKDYTMAKFMNKFTLVGNMYTASQMRDVADNIAEEFLPVEVKEALTLQDWIDMYELSKQSCMVSRSEHAGQWSGDFLSQVQKGVPVEKVMHPVVWYFYNPDVRGFYVRKRDSVTTRCIVINDDVFNYKMYSSGEVDGRALRAYFQEQGWEQMEEDDMVECGTASFTIPAYKKDNGEKVCPFPYVDSINMYWNVEYLEDTDEYRWSQAMEDTRPVPKVRSQTYAGFITHNHITGAQCVRCGGDCGRYAVLTNDNSNYCCDECAENDGYGRAKRSDHSTIWIAREMAFLDDVHGDMFTNREACISCGGLPHYKGHTYETEEEYPLTVHGYQNITHGDMAMTITRSTYRFLTEKGQIKEGVLTLGKAIAPPNINVTRGMNRFNRATSQFEK